MANKKSTPLRMCVACREMKDKKEMLRIVKTATGEIFLDFSSKAAGRGAYICDGEGCVEKLKKTRALNRAFSANVPTEVYEAIENEFRTRKSNGKS